MAEEGSRTLRFGRGAERRDHPSAVQELRGPEVLAQELVLLHLQGVLQGGQLGEGGGRIKEREQEVKEREQEVTAFIFIPFFFFVCSFCEKPTDLFPGHCNGIIEHGPVDRLETGRSGQGSRVSVESLQTVWQQMTDVKPWDFCFSL